MRLVPRSLRPAASLALFNLYYRMKWPRLPYPPLLVNLEPTNHCNLRCPMCPVSQMHLRPDVSRGLMDMAVFRRIVGQLREARPKVALNLGGESMLHPEFDVMVRTLKSAGLFVFVDTNATRLTRERSERLVEAGLDEIVLCLDGEDAESYEAMRAGASFEETVQNVRELLACASRAGGRVRTVIKNIRYWRPAEAPGVPPGIRGLFREHPPDEYRFTWADHWPGTHRHHLVQAYEAPPTGERYSPCINLWKLMAISWDGMVHICCLDLNREEPVGSVLDNGIMGVWNSERMLGFRRAHAGERQAHMRLCGNCNQIRRGPQRRSAGLLRTWETRFTFWHREHVPREGRGGGGVGRE